MSAPEQEQHKQEEEEQPLNEKSSSSAAGGAESNNTAHMVGAKGEKESGNADQSEEKQPAGGYDATPIPDAPPGWTIKFTFHKATNLPMADINSLSSDPFIVAQLNSDLPKRHKEDPPLRMRSPTVRRNTDPEWNFEWIVANVPSSGFRLKVRVYDEDPADHDDRLGNVHIYADQINEGWAGINNQPYKIMKRSGSKRAYMIRACAACFDKAKHLNGDLYVSVELLGRTPGNSGGKMYTLGPCWWIRHYSPMLGRITGRKEPPESDNPNNMDKITPSQSEPKKKPDRYNFQANEIQFPGPVPDQLYHRYVEFRPFVKAMFTNTGIRGFILSKALHHQHARVYNFDRSTVWGHFPQGPCDDMTRAFLDLVHYDAGGRIFTYVLSLDGLLRFTETGKEFGIDMLSKHTMHSDVSVYIAFSGEFFIRRVKYAERPPPPDPTESATHEDTPDHEENETHPPNDIGDGPPEEDPPKDPQHYELVIDNDSGTYRPNAKLLPQLKEYLAKCLPGIHILTLDSQSDADKMGKMKQQQRERKQKEGDGIIYAQRTGSFSSSVSSSDDERLDELEQNYGESSANDDGGVAHQLKQDVGLRGHDRMDRLKGFIPGHDRHGEDAEAGEGSASATAEDRGHGL